MYQIKHHFNRDNATMYMYKAELHVYIYK